MLSVLKILVLEKKEKDMESIQRVLHKAGLQFQIKKVDNRVCFEEALEQYVPEIILANHRVNNFEAAEALLLSRTKLPDIPFIMVTDKVIESYAVDMMKLGVSDYFLKDDLSKLPLAIQDYILKKPSENQNKVILENKLLQRSLTRNVAFLKAIPDLIFVLSRSGIFTDFHAPEGMETYVSPEAFLGKNILEVIPEPVASQTLKNIELVLNRELVPVHEYQLEYPDGLHDFGAKYAALGGNEVLVIVRDITKQKSVEREIHKEKIVSESLINSLPGVFYLITAEGKFLRWNRNFEEATGYSGEEIKDLYPLDLFADDEKGLLLQKIANVFKTGEDSIEANFLLKTGERKFYYLTGKAIVYDEKDCLIGVGIDLSERRDAEEAIEHNEKKLRTLVDQAADGILITDKNLRFTEVNNKFCGMVGYTREELLQMRMPELVSNYWNKPPLGLQKVKLDSSTLTETYFTRKNGTVFPVEINASLIENSSYLSFVRDITERRKINDLIGGEKKVMEMIATGRSIKEILDVVALNYEVICKNTLCSILLLDRESSRLYLGAAPHLPEDYNRAIDGAPLGPQAGSCGTAAYRKERVIVSDISRSPLWKDYKDLASSHNLKACWSNPILNKNDEVMGVFAIYAMIARNPTTEELQMVDRASYLVKIALERNENEIELRKREEKFRTLVESVSDAFVALDTNWKYTYVNRKAGELLNRDPAYLTGKHIWTEFPDAMGKPFQVAYEKAMRDQQQASLSEYFPDNNRWIENNIYPSPEGISVYFKDVTRQKLAEQKMIKNSRLYFFISQFNQMIIHARCEGILFKEACDIAVNVGNFKLAWIGILNNETHTLEPVMFSGKDEGYLSKLNIVVDKKNPTGEGPASTAIFSGKTICCNDIENDPKMIPWRTEALKRNFRSSIGLPIKKSGKVTGVFNLYSDVKGFFDEEEIALLERATDDISFALEIFENEKLKKKTDDEIGRSKRQFQNLVESISGVYWVNDVETYQTLYISPSYEKIWGRTCEDLYKNPADFVNSIHPEDRKAIFEAHKNIANSLVAQVNYRIIRPDGQIRWILARTNVVDTGDGKKLEYGYAEDITERKIAEANLEESQNRLKTILDNEPECVKVLNEAGEILEINPAGLAMLEADSLDQIKSTDLATIVNEPYFNQFTELINSVFKGKSGKLEFQITGLRGTHRWLETSAVPLRTAEGKIQSMLSVTRDISDRKASEEKEKQLTERLLKGAEIANFGFIDWNLTSNKINLSHQINEIYDIPEDILDVSEFIKKVVHPEDQNYVKENLDMAIKGEKEYNIDHRIIQRSGSVVWVNARAELIRDEHGKPVRLFGSVLDITENKNAELQIKAYNEKLRQLTAHLQYIREEERKRIGQEIHDELGQQLTAIKMDVAWIDKNTIDQKPAIRKKLSNIIELLDGSNQSVRKILNELRPGILENNGLLDAMQWHGEQFTSSTDIPVIFKIPEIDLELNEQTATCIFRTFQESLTNIMRYAKAKKVLISVTIDDMRIKVCIEDDGIGFDLGSLQKTNTFGILGMRERVWSMGGTFEVESFAGNGTKVCIVLPYDPDVKKDA